jgi:hypothetical protein
MPDKVTCVSGPVESVDGKLVLRIPLAAGGDQLVAASRGIGVVVEDYLEISIPAWLAKQLKITAGTVVTVDNRNGKFNITPEPVEQP